MRIQLWTGLTDTSKRRCDERYVSAETTVLSAMGAVVCVPLAYWSLRLLGAFASAGISGQVVGFSPAVAAAQRVGRAFNRRD
jgi:hypothetical protein